jgi:CubicO group peptidase (beta-lactamase class C family)
MTKKHCLILSIFLITFSLLLPVSGQGLQQPGPKFASVPGTTGAVKDDQFAAIREFIGKQMLELQVPSIAVAVARDGKIIWEEGFGWADREKLIAATPHTMYSLASISKPITATGLMILKERGLFDLDRPANDYLGEAKIKVRLGNPADLTVRRVANHSSGLPLHYQFFYADEPYLAPSRDETILRYANTVTAPGEKYQYSNLGYGILDYLITRLSGKPYKDFMRNEVFLPLGLTHMSVDLTPELEKHQAVRYGTDGLPIPFYDFDHPGGSAVYASAHDLVRFGLFHLKAHMSDQKAILTDQTIDDMHKSTMTTGPNSGYGIGWGSTLYPGNTLCVSHTGGMGGVATTLRIFPAQKLAIVVLSNSSSRAPHLIADQIMSTMIPGSAPKPDPRDAANISSEFKPDPALVGAWKGSIKTYKQDLPFTLVFQADGDVQASIGEQLKSLVNRTAFKDGYLTGVFLGDIGYEDANRTRYTLSLSLKLRGDVLNGGVSALSLPSKRLGNALTQWVELKKQ